MARRAQTFHTVGKLIPRRSAFDLSHRKLTTDDMGRLIPITSFTAIPGDTFTISNEVIIRFQPMFAPILHEINAYVHWYFCPWRIIYDYWEESITGGRTGRSVFRLPTLNFHSLPTGVMSSQTLMRQGELSDYLYNIPDGPPQDGLNNNQVVGALTGVPINAFKLYTYNKIYNEYYRGQDFVDPVPLYDYNIKYRSWEKDYFTTAMPEQQRGLAPAFPLNHFNGKASFIANATYASGSAPNIGSITIFPGGPDSVSLPVVATSQSYDTADNFRAWLDQNRIDVTSASLFDVSDVRYAFQATKYLERNQRAGARYTEWLRAHYGVAPTDARLDRPEYIGGSKSPVIISEVLQTSQSDATPQANMAGHALTADRGFIGKYHVQEFGTIMAILSVMPRATYSQGIDRQDVQRTKYEFPLPEFAHVSERAVEKFELYPWYYLPTVVPGSLNQIIEQNTRIFGYNGMYDEYRYIKSTVHGDFKYSLNYWHLARLFPYRYDNAPTQEIYLNRSFIECNPQHTKRVFNVRTGHGLMISFGAHIKAVRPLPFIADPAFVDHF